MKLVRGDKFEDFGHVWTEKENQWRVIWSGVKSLNLLVCDLKRDRYSGEGGASVERVL